jgi:hypothetical protein
MDWSSGDWGPVWYILGALLIGMVIGWAMERWGK